MVIPFAMLVVCFLFPHCSNPDKWKPVSTNSNAILGLYYKLHGNYRPTTMKKTIIKRRKRVVPAVRDQSPTGATNSSNGSSASPEGSPAGLARGQDDYHYRYMSAEPTDHYPPMSTGRVSPQTAPRSYTFAPPPVDFTGYGTVSLPHHPPPPRLLEPERMGVPSHSPSSSQFGQRSVSPNTSNNPKKRARAETTNEPTSVPATLESGSNQLPPIMSSVNPTPPARLSSISSILNHTEKRREDTHADPSLAAYDRQQQHPHHPTSHPQHHHRPPPQAAPLAHPPPPPRQPLPGVNELDGYASERRIKLQREAEEMREALRAKERELAEFGK